MAPSSSTTKNPPTFDGKSNYDTWEKALDLWELVTDVEAANKGPIVALSFTGDLRETVLEIPIDDLKSTQGVQHIKNKLRKIYKKDSVETAYETFESFIYFKRKPQMSITEFVNEFEKRYNKSKEHKFELSSSTRAFFLLNQANLSEDHKKLVKATISQLEYEEMKTKLRKVFGGESSSSSSVDETKIKVEDINLGEEEEFEEDVLYGGQNSYRQRGSFKRFTGYRGGYSNRGAYSGSRDLNQHGRAQQQYGSGRETGSYGKPQTQFKTGRSSLNSLDKRGNRLRCAVCESIYHYSGSCPEKAYFNTTEQEQGDHDIILYQSNLLTSKEYKTFVAEASVAAILDSGASASVAGKVWLEGYVEGLPKHKQEEVEYYESGSTFKFGSQERFKSLFRVKIPAKIGNKEISIVTDVIDSTIPLLLSKDAMKKADTSINFKDDTVVMLGEKQKILVTQSGHYAIPLNSAREVLRDIETSKDCKITLNVQSTGDTRKIASKLHSQFGHPPSSKLIKLLERAGRGEDRELKEELQLLDKNCKICIEHTRPSPKPVVGLPHATCFNEMVAMDLKFYEGKIILHMIDHLTRFSTAVLVKSKEAEEIISGIFKSWIQIFGPPKKFLTDNGGEFANEKFLKMAESMNIRVLTTAAESPWSNGLVERHNATLAETLRKVMAENKTDLETALAWTVNAKNSLANVHGFSPAQLAIGSNPQLPNVHEDKMPALEPLSGEDVITKNLNCMRRARKAFIEAESSEKIKRALVHNVRPSSKNKFVNGDIVFYKRNDARRWKGPGKVIGHDSSNILIKHGANYVRVHACRVLPDKVTPQDIGEAVSSGSEEKGTDEETAQNHDTEPENRDSASGEDLETSSETEVQPSGFGERRNIQRQERKDDEVQSQNKLKKGMLIELRTVNGDWEKGEVLRRTGKATGRYKDYWEIKTIPDKVVKELDMVKDVVDWKILNSDNELPASEVDINYTCVDMDRQLSSGLEEEKHILIVEDQLKDKDKADLLEVKKEEMNKWIQQNVYEEVSDEGQKRLSTTWVITKKEDKGEVKMKARLVVRGYEEQNNEIRSDSPTCAKENIRMLLGIAGTKGWKVHSLDVKAAFLQGKEIEREVYIKPPSEFRKSKMLWKLKKVVYGLCDASRNWYLRVVEVLESLGMKVSKFDNAVFSFKNGDLQGLVLMHVDDMLYFGNETFLLKVIKPFKKTFRISKEETCAFKYVGISVTQYTDSIQLDQKQYLDTVNADLLPKEALKDKYRFVDESEKRTFRQGIGQLGWLTSISRPEAAFDYCVMSTRQAKPQVSDFFLYRKAVREMKNNSYEIRLKKLNTRSMELTIFSDASFGNLSGGASQLGFIVFLNDKEGNAIPVSWASRKSKRVARSTLTAETLAAVEAVDAAMMCRKVLEDLLDKALPPIKLLVDNKSLYETSQTSNVLADKRLMIDMSALRQMVTEKEVLIQWIPASKQLADVLTKSGANKAKLINVLSCGNLKGFIL